MTTVLELDGAMLSQVYRASQRNCPEGRTPLVDYEESNTKVKQSLIRSYIAL